MIIKVINAGISNIETNNTVKILIGIIMLKLTAIILYIYKRKTPKINFFIYFITIFNKSPIIFYEINKLL